MDALSKNDAHLERLMGTDNYMALTQALDMTVASGQTGQQAATGPALGVESDKPDERHVKRHKSW